MNTEHIKAIFEDYLKKENTSYAVLLNGSWGSGKTFYWKYTLTEIAENNEFKTIYISLNGISKIEQLEHQLFLKLIPFIGNQENKKIKNATKLLANFANVASKKIFKTSLSEIFKDMSVDAYDFSKHIICFDDLERCQIPVKEVLGFINNYVEHKNLKTIIIGDEVNIDSKQKGYNSIKEKVIGRILNFKINIKDTFPQLLKGYEHKSNFHAFLSTYENFIIQFLNEYNQSNLRIIAFYLDVLEKIHPTISTINEKYIKEILLFSALISIEFKNGQLESNDYRYSKNLELIDEHYYSMNLTKVMRETSKDKNKQREKPYNEIFYEKYLHNWIEYYFFYPSIYSYILSGYINHEQLETEINKRYPIELTQEVECFRKIINYKFRELSNDEFQEVTTKTLKFAEEGKYYIYDYISIYSFYSFFSKNKLIDLNITELNKKINAGLNISKKRKEINSRVLKNSMYFDDPNPKIKKLKEKIQKIHISIEKEKHIKEANKLIYILLKMDEFALAELFHKHSYSRELFQNIEDKTLFETLTQTSNKQLFNFTELLKERYNTTNVGEFLFEDYATLTSLKGKLNSYLRKNKNLHRLQSFLLKGLVQELLAICKKLDLTKKK